MGFLDGFISIKRDDDSKKNVVAQKSVGKKGIIFQDNSDVTTQNPPQQIVTDVATYNSGSATQDALNYFDNLLEEKNLPGTDYLEFQKAINDKNLKALPSEQTRYAAAFVGMAAGGLTKEKLIETGNKYSELIDEDLANLENSFKGAYSEKVEKPRQQVDKLNQEMQELSKQIEAKNAQANQLAQEATESENTLSANKNSFEGAAQIKKTQIQKEIEKISNYIID